METNIYAYKCMNCGMHFHVYSWHADWSAKNTATCPECGKTGACFLLRQSGSDKFIFEFVPGPMSEEARAAFAALEADTPKES